MKKKYGNSVNYEKIVEEVARMSVATQQIMPIVKEQIEKGWKQIPNVDAKRSTKSWFYDPLSVQFALGYKDRNFSLTFDILKRTVQQLALLNAIINLRCAQVAAFSQPYRSTRSLGFVIKHKDPDHPTTRAEVEFIKELEAFVLNCGRSERNPYSLADRDDFDTFLRKIVRDSLSYDQICCEVVPDKMGIPYEFVAVDASTIRFSADPRILGANMAPSRNGFNPINPKINLGPATADPFTGAVESEGKPTKFVQVVQGQIENVYNEDELFIGIRNPKTDILTGVYGYSEVEQLINTITGMLYAEEYNRNFFKQGSSPHGILNFKGDGVTDETIEGFRRYWAAHVTGVQNSHQLPVLNSEGLEFIDFHKTNTEMEFNKWIEYNIKTICGVFLIEPEEIGFSLSGGVSQTPLFESSSEWKLKASRDRGLKPLLKFVSKLINKNIIDKIDDHFALEFVGLDEMDEQSKHNMMIEQISSYMTLNEARRQLDMPDIEGGDIPMNPTYLQMMKMKMDADQAKQQMQQDQAAQAQQAQAQPQPGQDQAQDMQGQQPNALPGSFPDQPQQPPNYSSTFGLPDFPFFDDNTGE
jgi:hypothetical protein